MSDDKKTTQAAPLEPVLVTMIGTRSVSGGPKPMSTGTVAVTPQEHQPNLVTLVVSPLAAILIRFGHTFLTSMVGFIALSMVPPGDNMVLQAIQAVDFVTLLWTAAGLSLAPAGYDLLKNLVTIFARLESKFPLLTGNV